jgi:hypothetical protein
MSGEHLSPEEGDEAIRRVFANLGINVDPVYIGDVFPGVLQNDPDVPIDWEAVIQFVRDVLKIRDLPENPKPQK